jgi:hypothetical protein
MGTAAGPAESVPAESVPDATGAGGTTVPMLPLVSGLALLAGLVLAGLRFAGRRLAAGT